MKIIECPRDAMQGIEEFIPTNVKAGYINLLLQVGFDTIDFGSFVSPKSVPQMSDTGQVLDQLDLNSSTSKLLAIIANARGASDAATFDQIRYLGYPFSISETFQKLNTNSTIEESLVTLENIQNICQRSGKKLVVYLSMAFGNPYGDQWNTEIVGKWMEKLASFDVNIIALADTVGVADPNNISYIFSSLIPAFPNIEIGAHLHSTPDNWKEKVEAAFKNGCTRFDSAIKGFGGCPMAENELVGNLATENLTQYLTEQGLDLGLDLELLNQALLKAGNVFPSSDGD